MRCEICTDPNCPGPTDDPGDPHWDATDFAHPAWWRGQNAMVRALCARVNAILDDPVIGERGCAAEPWESTRRRIAELARERARVGALLEQLQSEVRRLREVVNRAVGEDLRRQLRERMSADATEYADDWRKLADDLGRLQADIGSRGVDAFKKPT